uniref:HAT C-terminal dimerisation domain-containing protein n=1 Tax=Trichogramma kaykai TaxID=54128 RepID=A0ABD2XCV9_9HYME
MELRASGENLGYIVLKKLKNMGINLDYCVEITTDGCSVMTSNDCGAVKTVVDEAKNATYCPCYNHKLNLSISKSSTVQEVRNSVWLMKEVIAFFKASSKRSRILQNVMGHQLHGLCETRWVERHDRVIQFQSCISKIIETLESVAKWKDISAAAKTKSLKSSLSNGEFIVSMMCLANLLTCTIQLSSFFQKTQTDMKSANDLLQETLTILHRKRDKSVEVFSNIFEEAKNIADEIDAEIKVPRLANVQKNRSNYPCDSAEDYYRKAIFIPLLDSVIEDLKFRFPEETLNLFDLFVLFPTNGDESECEEALNRLSNKYAYLFNKSTDIFKKMLSSELEFYRLHCENKKITSCSALELLDHCDDEVFPIVTMLLKILATLPISSCNAERSFSSLRRIKDWLRSTMSKDRLDGLALMNIHWNVKINVEKVIDRFAKNRNHRIDFVL